MEYLYGRTFLYDQTPKNYLIMLGLFSIRISDFYTTWLPKCFVVDLANFGEISGGHFAYVFTSPMKYVTGFANIVQADINEDAELAELQSRLSHGKACLKEIERAAATMSS